MYSLENYYRVWDDNNGCYWQIGPDADCCGCVEVVYFEKGFEKPRHQFVAPPQAAILIAEAIKKVAESMPKEL